MLEIVRSGVHAGVELGMIHVRGGAPMALVSGLGGALHMGTSATGHDGSDVAALRDDICQSRLLEADLRATGDIAAADELAAAIDFAESCAESID